MTNEVKINVVLRGGSWNYTPQFVRSASRGRYSPALSYINLGFRLVKRTKL